MKLSQYAKSLGIHYRTAWNMFKKGQIPHAYQLPSGTIIVPNYQESKTNSTNTKKKVCVYARVSSSQNKKNLESQVERLKHYCKAQNWEVIRVAKEIASGINDNRKILINIFTNIDKYDLVVIEHKDRLTRMGFNYFRIFVPNKIHVVNVAENDKDDLTQDLVAIITSFCARLYGLRKGKRKTEKIIQELENDE